MRGRTIALTAAAIAVVSMSGCTSDDTGQGRPTRVTCVEGGKIVLDDFTKEGDTRDIMTSHGYFAYTSSTQQGDVNIMGTCITRPQKKPAGWKPIFPG